MVFFGILFGSQETEVYPMITYEIPCLLGLEKLVADEIKRLGLADVRAENGSVRAAGRTAPG
jgi:23S rRNA G2445 N2-methylase RlmL